jgi:hypothetical protein
MKDEIKQQIEDEVKKYIKTLSAMQYKSAFDFGIQNRSAFAKGAEYGYSLAQQSCICSSIAKG